MGGGGGERNVNVNVQAVTSPEFNMQKNDCGTIL